MNSSMTLGGSHCQSSAEYHGSKCGYSTATTYTVELGITPKTGTCLGYGARNLFINVECPKPSTVNGLPQTIVVDAFAESDLGTYATSMADQTVNCLGYAADYTPIGGNNVCVPNTEVVSVTWARVSIGPKEDMEDGTDFVYGGKCLHLDLSLR